MEKKYLLLTTVLLSLLGVTTLNGRLWSEMGDGWEHAASVNELSRNLFNPSNPFLSLEGNTTPRFTLYIVVLALIKRVSNLPIFDLMEIAGMANAILLISGVYIFIRMYSKNVHQPFFTLITLLIFWGRGWLYSNEYSLQFLTSSLFHPSCFTFAISFWGWYSFLKFKKEKAKANFIMTVLISILVSSAHPLTASFFFIVMFLLNFHQKDGNRLGFYLIGTSFFLSLIILLLWPYFSIFEALEKGALSGGWYPTGNYFYAGIISGAGISLLGIPAGLYYLFQRKHLCIILGFSISVLIYVISYLLNLSLLGRYIYFSIFHLHLLLSFFLAALWYPSSQSNSPTRRIVKASFILTVLALSLYQFKLMNLKDMIKCSIHLSPTLSIKRCYHPRNKYDFLSHHLQAGDVVLSDTFTSWIIPAMTGAKVVSLFHDNPLVSDNDQRMKDTAIFFSPATDRLKRREIVKHYRVTHVLIHKGLEDFEFSDLLKEWGIYVPSFSPQLIESLTSLGNTVYRDDTYILVKL